MRRYQRMRTRITSMRNCILWVASIAFHIHREKELSMDEQAVRPSLRQSHN